MDIGVVGAGAWYGGLSRTSRIKEDNTSVKFSDTFGQVQEKSEVELNLEYYHSLCEEFSGITFRLEDIRSAIDSNNKGQDYLGYNGSMHQVGDNFGGIGQCSIEIDVAVIERMRNDPRYETAVKSYITDSQNRFKEYQAEDSERPYTYVCIEDENGRIQRSRGHSSVRPATEEELKQKTKARYDEIQFDSDKLKDELIDSYLRMIEESERKRKELQSLGNAASHTNSSDNGKRIGIASRDGMVNQN